MKATELRIGNWIDTLEGPAQIEAISDSGIIATSIIPSGDSLGFLKPIPLAEEWLFKFKWKYQDRDVNRSDGKKERFYISPFFGEHREYWIELQLSNNSFGHSFMWLCWDIGGGNDHIHFPQGHKIDYVHQLQNIFFALAGEEPTLKTELSQKER